MSKLPFEDGDVVGLKIFGLFVTSGLTDGSVVLASTNLDATALFTMVHKGGPNWAFQSAKTGKYLTVKQGGVVNCTGQVPLSDETFKLIGTDPRHVLFESVSTNNYLKAEVGRCVTISCTGRDINDQENYFEIERQ